MSKVCIMTSVHISNDTRIYFKELQSLFKANYEIIYIAPQTSVLPKVNFQVIDFKKPSSRFKRFFSPFKMYRIAKKIKADIYHFHDPELIITGILLKMFNKVKVIYDVHEDYPSYMLQKEYIYKPFRKFFAIFMSIFNKIADMFFDGIITADEDVLNKFKNQHKICLYNFPDYDNFILSKIPLKKKYDLIYPGSVSLAILHNIANLVKTIQSDKKDISVLIVSSFNIPGKQKTAEKIFIESGVLRDNFHLINRVPYSKVCYYMELSRIGLIPLPMTLKFQKNIPTKMFEYLYAGIPIVSNDLKPVKNFLGKQEFCIIHNFDNLEILSKSILRLLKDENLLNTYIKIERNIAIDNYNWSTQAEKLKLFYKEILYEKINYNS